MKTVPDAQMTSPNTVREILLILREAWACPRCARSPDDQQPNVTALLLEHLQGNTSGPIQSEIAKTRTFILEQTRPPTEAQKNTVVLNERIVSLAAALRVPVG